MKWMTYIHLELSNFKHVKLDVCGSLVLSNPVTHTISQTFLGFAAVQGATVGGTCTDSAEPEN